MTIIMDINRYLIPFVGVRLRKNHNLIEEILLNSGYLFTHLCPALVNVFGIYLMKLLFYR